MLIHTAIENLDDQSYSWNSYLQYVQPRKIPRFCDKIEIVVKPRIFKKSRGGDAKKK